MTALADLPEDWQRVVELTCRRHGLGAKNVMERSRRPRTVRCRFDVWAALHEAGENYETIGAVFGYDRSSVSYGVRRAMGRV